MKTFPDQFFSEIVENSDDFIFSLTPDYRFEYVNPSVLEFLGYTNEEMLGMPVINFIFSEDHAKVKFTFKKFAQNLPTDELSVQMIKKPNIRFPIIVRAKTIKIGNNVSRIIAIGRRPVKSLLNYTTNYQDLPIEKKILSNIPGVVWTCDQDLKTIYVSPTSNEILGFHPDAVINNPKFWHEQVLPQDLPSILKAWKVLYERNEPYDVEYRFKKKDGSIIWLRDRSFGFSNREGEWLADGILSDITNVKEIQMHLAQSSKMEALGRFAGGIAHDFNNMLTIINGFSDILLLENSTLEEVKESAGEIKKASVKAAKLTQEILLFSRKQIIESTSLDLNDNIHSSYNFLKTILGETINLEIQSFEGLWMILADSNQIDQILLNLVWNAKDAMLKGGKVIIKLNNFSNKSPIFGYNSIIPKGEFVTLSIEDTGSGISENHLLHLFEPFYTTKAKGKGTGLGLSIVYGIISQNDAFIDVNSRVNEGTSFIIYFPRYIGEKVLESSHIKKKKKTYQRENISILLVEDEEGIRNYFSRGLKKKGYDIILADNGKEALSKLSNSKKKIDILISDVVMPELDGYSLSKIVSQKWPNIEIILMSGYPEDYLGHDNIISQKIGFIPKPIDLDLLVETIQKRKIHE